MNRIQWTTFFAGVLLAHASNGFAGDLANQAFQIKYDASGIRSLKRANDTHDTEYIGANGILGSLVIRYRSTPNGDWRELRDLLPVDQPSTGQTVRYRMAASLPTLAAKSTASAAVGVGGLRALNDGQFPRPAGRGFGPGGPPAGTGRLSAPAGPTPFFTWSGSRGEVQWVQYTFPTEQEVSRSEVFWIADPAAAGSPVLPQSWRLLYREGREWKEVQKKADYSLQANAFNIVEFAPVRTLALRIEARMTAKDTASIAEWRVGPEQVLVAPADLDVEQTFKLDGQILDWTVMLVNSGPKPIEIGDLAVPLSFAERIGQPKDLYIRKLLRHSLVAGHGSWIYWQRSGGDGPYLVMTPTGQTKFEYFESSFIGFTPYVHAKAAGAAAVASGGNWRLPVTNLKLAPKGSSGATVTYSFRFQWAEDTAAVRDVLYKEGKFDTVIVPGMTIPTDLPAMISLRTQNKIEAVEAEHPESTRVEFLGERTAGAKVYRVKFSKLGENMLKVKYSGGQWTSLEFFVTEPIETLIHKRAAFLVDKHQHKDPSKWYVGTYGDWDQKNEILRGPEDRDGLSTWLTDANDDAGNARPAYIASKNVFFPNPAEIESLELYLSKYLWGGMQMTEKEKYPYAIYGIPNWKVNRESSDEGRNGQAHVWRIYDYHALLPNVPDRAVLSGHG